VFFVHLLISGRGKRGRERPSSDVPRNAKLAVKEKKGTGSKNHYLHGKKKDRTTKEVKSNISQRKEGREKISLFSSRGGSGLSESLGGREK